MKLRYTQTTPLCGCHLWPKKNKDKNRKRAMQLQSFRTLKQLIQCNKYLSIPLNLVDNDDYSEKESIVTEALQLIAETQTCAKRADKTSG